MNNVLRIHISPYLGDKQIQELSPAHIRSWRKTLIDKNVGQSTISKAYRFLRAVLNTAVDDELINRNPCRIFGASVDRTPERPLMNLSQVMTLASVITPRYKCLVLLSVFGSLRWGELMGLRRSDIDLKCKSVKIQRSISEVSGQRVVKLPKSAAGLREVVLPDGVFTELAKHLATYAESGDDGRVFIGAKGATPFRSTFQSIWTKALTDAGLVSFHFHDLRHAGNHFAAISGATTRELMARMGHASMRAAIIYQHQTAERDRKIADALDRMIAQLPGAEIGESGHDEGTTVK